MFERGARRRRKYVCDFVCDVSNCSTLSLFREGSPDGNVVALLGLLARCHRWDGCHKVLQK